MKKLITVFSVCAVFLLLFAACKDDNGSKGGDTKKPDLSFAEEKKLVHTGTITLEWLDYYTANGYTFFFRDWDRDYQLADIEGKQTQYEETMAIPPGSYFRVVFDGLYGPWTHGEWPDEMDRGRVFKDQFIYIAIRGGDWYFINLEGLGKVEDGDDYSGVGEAFFSADILQKFMFGLKESLTPWSNFFQLAYMNQERPGQFDSPKIKIIKTGWIHEGSGSTNSSVIELEIWSPVAPVAITTQLQLAINSAETLLASVTRTNDGNSLAAGTKWAFNSDHDAFSAAITEAKSVVSKTGLTRDEVLNAEVDLQKARDIFELFLITVGVVNKIHLEIAVASANELIEQVERTNDGSDLPGGTLWAPETFYDAFAGAIGIAAGVLENAATQAQIFTGVENLAVARSTFEANITRVLRPVFPYENYNKGSNIMLRWQDYYTERGFVVSNWFNSSMYQEQDNYDLIMALDPESYFKVTFEGLGNEWPRRVIGPGQWDNYDFASEYLRFGVRWSHGSQVGMQLEWLSEVENGQGDAFFKVGPIQENLETHREAWEPIWSWCYLSYGYNLKPGGFPVIKGDNIVELMSHDHTTPAGYTGYQRIYLEVYTPK